MRWAAVTAILIGAAIGYLALLHQFRVSEAPEEREFGVSQVGEELVQVYIEPISIDALNHSMRGHVSLVASRALRGRSLTAPDCANELTNVPAGMIRRETPLFFWYMSLTTSPTTGVLMCELSTVFTRTHGMKIDGGIHTSGALGRRAGSGAGA